MFTVECNEVNLKILQKISPEIVRNDSSQSFA